MRTQIHAAGLCALIALAGAGGAAQASETVPVDIQVPAGNKLYLTGHAIGVQIHECAAAGSGYAWKLVAPRANLYSDAGKLIATHYGGPTWEARDGSKVMGQKVGEAVVDPTAIPWLKLTAVSPTAGPDGDRLAGTTFIQRVATTGGRAPAAADCTAASAGTRVEVPYTADYHFWKAEDA